MASEGLYDMRKKLLELQNELLKDAMDKQETPSTPSPRPIEKHEELSITDMMKLVKEIHSNQQDIMSMLAQILEQQNKKI